MTTTSQPSHEGISRHNWTRCPPADAIANTVGLFLKATSTTLIFPRRHCELYRHGRWTHVWKAVLAHRRAPGSPAHAYPGYSYTECLSCNFGEHATGGWIHHPQQGNRKQGSGNNDEEGLDEFSSGPWDRNQ
jgi:hypothetical protein